MLTSAKELYEGHGCCFWIMNTFSLQNVGKPQAFKPQFNATFQAIETTSHHCSDLDASGFRSCGSTIRALISNVEGSFHF